VGWHVRYNHLGAVAAAMPKAIGGQVDDTARKMVAEFKTTLWVDTGMIRRVTSVHGQSHNHAEVWIGYNRGHGFYSRFQEWGTIKQNARPIVGPTAHRYEPLYAKAMADSVRKACNAR
jgi:HK97 gp10 family phage protein